MRTVSSADAARRFGALLDDVREGPVAVSRRGRPWAVMLSRRDFDILRTLIARRTEDRALGYVHETLSSKPIEEMQPRNLLRLMRSLRKLY